jgi:hypothetical protein
MNRYSDNQLQQMAQSVIDARAAGSSDLLPMLMALSDATGKEPEEVECIIEGMACGDILCVDDAEWEERMQDRGAEIDAFADLELKKLHAEEAAKYGYL